MLHELIKSHLVAQEMDKARQCLGRLYVVWTGQMRAHWLAAVAPRTSPPGGQWLRLQPAGAEMKDTGGSCPPHLGQEDPLPQRVQGRPALQQEGRVLGGPCWRCFAGWRERASRHRRARSPRHGSDHPDLGADLALQKEKGRRTRIETEAFKVEIVEIRNYLGQSWQKCKLVATYITSTSNSYSPTVMWAHHFQNNLKKNSNH